MKKGNSNLGSKKANIILVFGESENDREAIKNLIKAINPKIDIVKCIRKPPILQSKAEINYQKRIDNAERIKSLVKAESIKSRVIAVVAHEDCDQVEPAHTPKVKLVEKGLKNVGVPNPIAACPAFEIEAWWLLWPEAIRKVRSCWRKIPKKPNHVGKIENAKEYLQRELRPKTGNRTSCPEFKESDGIAISKIVLTEKMIDTRDGKSDSFDYFESRILKL